jgi:ABC-type lipoprotein export system ATPase subunit
MKVMMRTEKVWKVYGKDTPRQVDAVSDASVEITRGSVTALGGPSGSGKTTLLSILGLLTKPTSGRVFLDDEEYTDISDIYRTKIRRNKIGFIFQARYLIPHLTSVENVALPMLCTDMSRKDAETLAKDQLSTLGLEHRLDFRVAELSGGEQQRVSIARSLMNRPSILIADEPSSSIDEDLTQELLSTLRHMVETENLTVLVASHDPRVLDWADIVYTMQNGSIL